MSSPPLPTELAQRVSVTRRRRFRLTPDGLEVVAASLQVRRKFTVPTATLLDKPREEWVSSTRWLVLAALFGIATCISLATLAFDKVKAERIAPLVWAVPTAL